MVVVAFCVLSYCTCMLLFQPYRVVVVFMAEGQTAAGCSDYSLSEPVPTEPSTLRLTVPKGSKSTAVEGQITS